jgi:hypothetical protein
MKKFILGGLSAIMLGMVFISGSFGSNDNRGPIITTGSLIRYVVTVHPPTTDYICGTYLVLIVNGAGNKVGPAKYYQPGISEYTFYELGPVRNAYRVAVMIPAPGLDDGICIYPLVTKPDIHYSTFENGMSYFFDLYPSPHGTH